MSEETTETTPDVEVSGEDVSPPEVSGWWNFESKESAVDWMNDKIQKRLAREKSKFDPIANERDTLKARVAELEPFEQATKTDTQRWEDERASLAKEVEDLRSFQKQAQRDTLVREIADEKGLPTRFLTRVAGDDADSITADIEELMTVLNDGKPKPATRKPTETDERPSSKGYGGGGSSSDSDDKTVVANIRKKFRENSNRTFVR